LSSPNKKHVRVLLVEENQQDAERAAQSLNSISAVPSSTVVAPPDPYALYLAMLRITPIERIPTE